MFSAAHYVFASTAPSETLGIQGSINHHFHTSSKKIMVLHDSSHLCHARQSESVWKLIRRDQSAETQRRIDGYVFRYCRWIKQTVLEASEEQAVPAPVHKQVYLLLSLDSEDTAVNASFQAFANHM